MGKNNNFAAMGRMFEKRKHKMFARYDRMAKQFTKLGKEIAIAVKMGGENPEYNPRLRVAMQNAKTVNMPKDRVEAAIKRALSKTEGDYEEVRYEGYAPHGIGVIVETATDNPTRTVANVRMHFNKSGGSLGKTGSLDFNFTRKGVFKISKANLEGKDLDEFELELIDFGLDDFAIDEEEVYVYSGFNDFGAMQKALEEMSIEVSNAELQYIPNSYVELTSEQAEEILNLVEKLEGDDDVQNVYHNLN
jgi:YebC/PmpR family DNA-binding regulatory protein